MNSAVTDLVNEPPVLELKDLTVQLKNSQPATTILNKLCLSIKSNQVVALIGNSGSGKSITTRAILGLLPAEMIQTSGKIYFNAEEISDEGPVTFKSLRGKKISMVFQEPAAILNPVFKIGTQFSDIVRTNLSKTKVEAGVIANDLLREVGFEKPSQILNSYPGQLSGGMAQRVVIAFALSINPELLIADEPTSALDSLTQAKLIRLIFELKRKHSFAILFISHDLKLVSGISDAVYQMSDGTCQLSA